MGMAIQVIAVLLKVLPFVIEILQTIGGPGSVEHSVKLAHSKGETDDDTILAAHHIARLIAKEISKQGK